jgi:uncharacterized protein YcbX
VKVVELWRYPVKSLAGERLERVNVLPDGLAGDRLLRVEDDRRVLTARTKQRLLGLRASLGADGEPLVDGRLWRDPEVASAIRRAAGEGARLARTVSGKRFDGAPVLVVSDGALAALGEDRRRFRANLVIAGVDGLAEREWIGARLRVGEATLAVREACERCAVTTIDPDTLVVDPEILRRINARFDGIMGVYCDVVAPGAVAEGDPAKLIVSY